MLRKIKPLVVWLSVELAVHRPATPLLALVKRFYEIQLSADQLKLIATTVKAKKGCRLLIFGMGNDSAFWSRLNRNGMTVFLEDNEQWHQRITERVKGLTSVLVSYNTRITDWKMLLESPSLLQMTLPDEVEKEAWDVILVDAPDGSNDRTTGRMKSIALASRLAGDPGTVFVHDCEREVENSYCNRFLKEENLKAEIDPPDSGCLRQYLMTREDTRVSPVIS